MPCQFFTGAPFDLSFSRVLTQTHRLVLHSDHTILAAHIAALVLSPSSLVAVGETVLRVRKGVGLQGEVQSLARSPAAQ